MDLNADELARYSRHLNLSQVGLAGQKKLKAARVLIIGLGGLGSPIALYLSAAGVGTLGLVEADTIELSNLQRQILYAESQVRQDKLTQAAARLQAINSQIQLELYPVRFDPENALELAKKYDLIIDGSDNFVTRYLANDAAVFTGKPLIYGSIFQFEGQVSVFNYQSGPCYRCLYPQMPAADLVPNCQAGGVLGVLPGLIGTLQATEALKLILEIGEPLSGRLLLVDALTTQFSEMRLPRDPACLLCGDQPQIHELRAEVPLCRNKIEAQISPLELETALESAFPPLILDVREPHELNISQLPAPEKHHIPLGELAQRWTELSPTREWVVYCELGQRSNQACQFLQTQGFSQVKNLAGGLAAWRSQGLKTEAGEG